MRKYLPDAVRPRRNPGTFAAWLILFRFLQHIDDLCLVHPMIVNMGRFGRRAMQKWAFQLVGFNSNAEWQAHARAAVPAAVL
jgi:hypothetical protein